MRELKTLIYESLEESPEDLINLIMEYITTHIYYKEHEVVLNLQNHSEKRIYDRLPFF